MPQSLATFLQQFIPPQSNEFTTIIDAMKILPPTVFSAQDSPYHFDHYKIQLSQNLRPTVSALKYIAEELLADISLSTPNCGLFWGKYPTEKKEAETIYAILKTAPLELLGTGNCSNRAAFSAFQLFKMLKGKNIKVGLISSPERDHFVVYLNPTGSKDGWMVYDPLTNPELIFTLQEYGKEILPLYPKITRKQGMEVKLSLDEDALKLYLNKKDEVKQHLLNKFKTLKLEQLYSNVGLKNSLTRGPFNSEVQFSVAA